MEELLAQSRALAEATSTQFQRFLHEKIYWDSRLIGVIGARGTGKTTLLLQVLKEKFGSTGPALYLSLDDIFFTEHRLTTVVRHFFQRGFSHFFLDEVHKYPGWSREIKNLYDFHPGLYLVFTGSSAVDVLKQEVDLSRRAAMYELPGLSFREFLNYRLGTHLEAIPLREVLERHEEWVPTILQKLKPLQYFDDYLRHGYYPFFKEHLPTYHHRLQRVMRLVVETDLQFIEGISTENVRKLHRLIFILASSVPFKPNVTKLSERIGIHRNTLVQYIHFLEKARVINLLQASGRSISTLQKPEKVYLENTNLAFALAEMPPNRGNLRETFFLSQVKPVAEVSLPRVGDFLLEDRYTIEVGGAAKTQRQIKDIKDAYVAADNVERGALTKIPLWLFGFTY